MFIIKNMTQQRRVMIDAVIAVTCLLISYYWPQDLNPLISTVFGWAGLIYVVMFLLDLIRLVRHRN